MAISWGGVSKSEIALPGVAVSPPAQNEFLGSILKQLPAGLRDQAARIATYLRPHESSAPRYFNVIANSINIMQDHITRSRLAGEPPYVMLLPRLRHISLMEFSRAKEAIGEGRYCVEQALPMLRRFI